MPDVLQRINEFKRVCELEQPEFDAAWQAVQQVLDEQFAYSCGEVGMARREKLLGIVPRSTADKDERVRAILFRLNEQLPFTVGKLQTLLDLVSPTGQYKLVPDYDNRELAVEASLYCKPVERLLREVLERTLPANILWDLYWEYNNHELLATMTHEELAARTHYQLREEVLA